MSNYCYFCKIYTFDKDLDLIIDDISSKHYIQSRCIFCNNIKLKHIPFHQVKSFED